MKIVNLASLLGRVFIVLVAVLMLIGSQKGCEVEKPTEGVADQGDAVDPGTGSGKTPYPKLDTRLYQLTLSKDPAAFAQLNDLHFSDGKVRVIIVLIDTLSSVSSDFQIDFEGQIEKLLQAMVPVDQLCALSQEPYVNFVRPPVQAVPHGNV